MATDPSVITSMMARWQAPQALVGQDPLAQYAKLQALRNGVTEQQLNQIKLQEARQSLSDQQALDAAYKGAITTDANGNVTYDRARVLQNAPGHLAPGIQKTLNEMDQQKATLDKAQADAATAKTDLLGTGLLGVKDADYDPVVFNSTLTHLAGIGAIDPRQAAAFSQQLGPNPTPDDIKAALTPLLSTPKVLELENKRAEVKARQQASDTGTEKLKLEKPGLEADAAQKQRIGDATALEAALTQGGPDAFKAALAALPADRAAQFSAAKTVNDIRRIGMTPEQRTQADQAKTNAEALAANRAADLDLRTKANQIAAAHLGLSQAEYNQKYGDVLSGISPNNLAIAQKLAVGDFDPAQLGRMPGKEQIIAAAIQLNPNWTPQVYATKKSFTDPEKTQAKNLGTISRIVSHIGQFEKNSQAMGLAPAYAAGVNLTGGQAALNEDAHAIAGELEKLVSGGVGSVEQTRAWQKALHSPSADARQKAIDEISQLVGGQYEGMNQTYKAATGDNLPIEKYVSPAGQKWMQTKGINVTNAVTPPGGSPGAGKSVTAQDVKDYAAKHNLSYADAEKHIKANGFTIQ
jgi:hypothetical protein